MVSPSTKWLPISRIACRVAARTAGAPSRLASRPMVPCGVSPGWITRADIPSAHAEALTRNALDLRLVMDEVALAELVLDELVGGAGVRHAQQRFRQHHQRQPLLGGEREFAQHVLDAAERIVIGPDRLDQPRRRAVDPRLLLRAQPRGCEQAGRRWRRSSGA